MMSNLYHSGNYKNKITSKPLKNKQVRITPDSYYKEKIELGIASRKFRDNFPNNTVYTLIYKENDFQKIRVFYNFRRVYKTIKYFKPDFRFTKKDIIHLDQGRIINIKGKLSFKLTKNILE